MSVYAQIIRNLSNQTVKNIPNMVPISVIKNTKLNINNEDDYHTIQSIIHSFNGSIYYNEKNGKFYFK